jgi:hypothetical protein
VNAFNFSKDQIVMSWNFDIASAPRGKKVTITETNKDGQIKEREEFRHDQVWLWTKCGRKTLSRWLPPSRFNNRGRWDGLATTEEPIAWHPYFVPADPVFPSEAHSDHLPIIEDCGSGQ